MLLILFSWQFWNIFQFQKDSPIYKSSHSFEVAELRLAPRSSDSNSFPVSKLGVNPPPEDALLPVWCCFPPSRLVKAQGEGRPLDPGGSYLCPHCQSWAAWCCDSWGRGLRHSTAPRLPPENPGEVVRGVWLSRGGQFPPKLED